MKEPRVVYWNNIPSPYMVDRFNALADRGNLTFEAWFSDRTEPDRSWRVDESNWRFSYRYLPTTRIFGHRQHWPTLLLRDPPALLFSLYAEPCYVSGWFLARARGVKTGFRVLKTYESWVERRPWKDALKRYMFRRVDAIETPGEDGRDYALQCGARSDRVFIVTHTVDIPPLRARYSAALADRSSLRASLGLEGVTFLYVGRLWWGKGVGTLLEAFELAQRSMRQPISLLIVGDGSAEDELRATCAARGLRGVVFAGFQQQDVLPKYIAAADIFVFPTLGDPYGLVVDEAMACGLPIISSTAAGEIGQRVRDGENGYLVPPQDALSLSERMIGLAASPSLCNRMGQASRRKIEGHTPMAWAKGFEGIVERLLQSDLSPGRHASRKG